MFGYYVALARTRLLETKGMSAALILALGLGIGASMTMLTVVRTMTWDPLPGRSEHLYHPFIDALPTSYDVKPGKDPRVALTWVDAQNLLRQAPASHQTALASARLLVDAQRSVQIPFFTQGSTSLPMHLPCSASRWRRAGPGHVKMMLPTPGLSC